MKRLWRIEKKETANYRRYQRGNRKNNKEIEYMEKNLDKLKIKKMRLEIELEFLGENMKRKIVWVKKNINLASNSKKN